MTNKEEIKKDNTSLENILFKLNEKNYRGDYYGDLLKQYTLYVEMMDNVSSRREKTNSFFLTANTVLLSTTGVIFKLTQNLSQFNGICIIICSIGGVIFSYAWLRLINEFKNLNTGKFQVIHLLETRMPAQLYKAEWEYLQPREGSVRYQLLTEIETKIPMVFIIIYVLLLIIGIVIFLLTKNIG